MWYVVTLRVEHQTDVLVMLGVEKVDTSQQYLLRYGPYDCKQKKHYVVHANLERVGLQRVVG